MAFLDSLGGAEVKGAADTRDNGFILARRTRNQVRMVFRPARLEAEPSSQEKSLSETTWNGPACSTAARLLRSDGFSAFAKRVTDTPVPKGGWEQNPALSAPKVHAEAMKAFKLSPEAATLYLQTLAMATPTARAVQLWNDWKPATYKKAAEELVGKKLLVEAKRERAGRDHFLPGPWEALKSPDLPIESWKLSLYKCRRENELVHKPLSRILPMRPPHELFAEALQRLQQGDRPVYEEVKSK